MDWRGVIFRSLRIWHLRGSMIFGSRRLIKVIPISAINNIRQLFKLSLNICIHSKSYPSKSRYKHYASRQVIHCVFTHVCVNRDKRSFIHSSYNLQGFSVEGRSFQRVYLCFLHLLFQKHSFQDYYCLGHIFSRCRKI